MLVDEAVAVQMHLSGAGGDISGFLYVQVCLTVKSWVLVRKWQFVAHVKIRFWTQKALPVGPEFLEPACRAFVSNSLSS